MRRQAIPLTSSRGTPNDSNPLISETQVTKGHTALEIGLSIGVTASIVISFLIGTFVFIHTRKLLKEPQEDELPMQTKPTTDLSFTPWMRKNGVLPNSGPTEQFKDTFQNYACSSFDCPLSGGSWDIVTDTGASNPAALNDSDGEHEITDKASPGCYTSASDTEVESEVSHPTIATIPYADHQQTGDNDPDLIRLFTADCKVEPGYAKCDTGSTENWITSEMLERLNIDMRRFGGRTSQSFETASGKTIRPKGLAEVSWTGNAQRTRKSKFLVADNLPVDVILGSRLLDKERIYTKNPSVLVLQKNKSKGKKGMR